MLQPVPALYFLWTRWFLIHDFCKSLFLIQWTYTLGMHLKSGLIIRHFYNRYPARYRIRLSKGRMFGYWKAGYLARFFVSCILKTENYNEVCVFSCGVRWRRTGWLLTRGGGGVTSSSGTTSSRSSPGTVTVRWVVILTIELAGNRLVAEVVSQAPLTQPQADPPLGQRQRGGLQKVKR